MKQKLKRTGLKKKMVWLSAILIVIAMIVPVFAADISNANVGQISNANPDKIREKVSSAVYGPTTAPRILIYADDYYHRAPNTYIDSALQRLGLGYTAFYDSNFTGFNTALTTGGPWDLVIFGQEQWGDSGNSLSNLNNYVSSGGKLIARSWTIGSYSSNPLWNTMGFTWVSNDGSPPDPVYWWNPRHPFFSGVPQLTSLTDGRYGVYGQYVQPLPTATALAGYTPASSSNDAALILRNDGKTLFMGFMDGQNDADLDSDSVPDGIELWTNVIRDMSLPSPSTTVVKWSAVASTGAIDDADTGIFVFDGIQAYIKSSAPLPANLDIRYNVFVQGSFDGNKPGLRIRYRDNGGSSAVKLYLKEYNVTSGLSVTRMSFDSNSYTQSSSYQTRTKSYCNPGWTFDFNNNIYYIEASLNKTASTGSPGLSGIQLTSSTC